MIGLPRVYLLGNDRGCVFSDLGRLRDVPVPLGEVEGVLSGAERLLLAARVQGVDDEPAVVSRVRPEVELPERERQDLVLEQLPREPLGRLLVLAELEREPRRRTPIAFLPGALQALVGGETESRGLELGSDLSQVDPAEQPLDTEHRASGVRGLGLGELGHVLAPDLTDVGSVAAQSLCLRLVLSTELVSALDRPVVVVHAGQIERLIQGLVQVELHQNDVRPRSLRRVRTVDRAVHVPAPRPSARHCRPARHLNCGHRPPPLKKSHPEWTTTISSPLSLL